METARMSDPFDPHAEVIDDYKERFDFSWDSRRKEEGLVPDKNIEQKMYTKLKV